ncbi:MAG: adenylyl-sulfate kinase [Proteobacteria bacterium]|nr:adenylyl-sulfate kinase [Pseudomonadota bacterium]
MYQKQELINTKGGCAIWFTGLSGSGKTTCSRVVARMLKELGLKTEILDGDIIRENLSKGLGFSKEERDTNIRRIGFVSDLLVRNDVFVCVAAISPYRDVRHDVREKIGNCIMVYCTAPLDILEERDVKGLYKRARNGEIKNFTGVTDPYEAPRNPEVVVRSDGTETVEESAKNVISSLARLGYISTERNPTLLAVGSSESRQVKRLSEDV